MKRIELSISTKYVSHWSVQEALRELFQNAIDREQEDSNAKLVTSVEYSDDGTCDLIIANNNTTLNKETLLLGETSKTDDDSMIGKFGEGYKLAMLVLLRNNIGIKIYTSNEEWKPVIEKSESFNSNVLVIYIDNSSEISSTVFNLSNLSQSDYEEHCENNLKLQNEYNYIETSTAEILTEERHIGKIFVGGLFVCNNQGSKLHGYNFKPGIFELGRDRQVIDGFNLSWNTSRALVDAAIEDSELCAKLIFNIDNEDQQFLSNFVSRNSELLRAAWQHFIERYPDCVPIRYASDAKEMSKKYIGIKTVVVSDRLYQLLIKTEEYEELLNTFERVAELEEPMEIVNKFYNKYASKMRKEVKEAFAKYIIAPAIDWRNEE